MPELVVENLYKRFGQTTAVDHISFTVRDGEFLTLLGPSGCGKSTTLAAIAGLDQPDGGLIRVGETIFFDGATGRLMVPEQRNCGLVFQSYALWPHMTVAENLAFPLKLRKVSKSQQAERIHETLKLVELENHKDRYPHQLSGGQQQRVALARALVYSPSILLLDEPLSNLDAKLRERARVWLKHLQQNLGITTIYVTHDQIEALALSDRIAVMQGGHIRQLATPQEIYEQPADPFVADFIGTSSFLHGQVVATPSAHEIEVNLTGTDLRVRVGTNRPFAEGAKVTIAVRPEKVEVHDGNQSGSVPSVNLLPAKVMESSYLGARHQYTLAVGDAHLRVEIPARLTTTEVMVSIPIEGCAVFPAVSAPSAGGAAVV
jgi:iron(III) transport system ATP-binding protein